MTHDQGIMKNIDSSTYVNKIVKFEKEFESYPAPLLRAGLVVGRGWKGENEGATYHCDLTNLERETTRIENLSRYMNIRMIITN